MLNYAIAAAHFARASKQFQQAVRHAEQAAKLYEKSKANGGSLENALRAAEAIQAGQLAERLSEEDLLNWRGQLPPGMTGAE